MIIAIYLSLSAGFITHKNGKRMSNSALESGRIGDFQAFSPYSNPLSQTTQFFFFGVQVSGLGPSTQQVNFTLVPSGWILSGDTQGSTTVRIGMVELRDVGIGFPGNGAIVGTFSVVFTTDFNAQTATAEVTGTWGGNPFAYTGTVASWANSAT